jgi:6-phosphogluconolactonase
MDREIVVTDDVAGAAAERIAAAVRASGQIVLAGGSTPRKAYEKVAGLDLDWSGVELWLGDDRAVASDHEHSNYRMVRQSLGDPAPMHWIQGELGYVDAADAYEAELRAAAPQAFDLILLGLGPDAHTASLFPGDAALGERERLAVGVETPGMAPLVSRVTLTLPVLNAGKEVVFLISGEDKADAVARAFGDAPDPAAPASLVQPTHGHLTLLLDPPAAARLGAAG